MSTTTPIKRHGRLMFDVIFSEDDGGYYCEIWDRTGTTVHTTDLHRTETDATDAAYRYCQDYEMSYPGA